MSEAASVTAAADVRPLAAPLRRRLSFRAVFGLTVLLCMGGAAVFAPQIAPWDPARQSAAIRYTRPDLPHKCHRELSAMSVAGVKDMEGTRAGRKLLVVLCARPK